MSEHTPDADMVQTPEGPVLDGAVGGIEPTLRLRSDAGDIACAAIKDQSNG